MSSTLETKPAKPTPRQGSPLYAHPSGQWCKTIRGVKRYFGVWADEDAAIALYEAEKDDWHAGVNPRLSVRVASPSSVTIKGLCDAYHNFKLTKLKLGRSRESRWGCLLSTTS